MVAHSLIGASSMSRWSKCPGSVRLSQGVDKKSSAWAEEGSDAHAYAAMCLTRRSQTTKPEDIGKEFKFDGRQFLVTQEMQEAVAVYVDEICDTHQDGDVEFVEKRFDLSAVHPGCFGTADHVRWRPSTQVLTVRDYKHGAGLPVEVVTWVDGQPVVNPQGAYYSLGALLELGFPAKKVVIQIVQPRCDHPDGPVRSWEIDAMDLLDFRADLKGYAEATEDPNAPLVPGEHCRFCPARIDCPELESHRKEVAKLDFSAGVTGYDAAKLKWALSIREPLKAWIKAVDELGYAEAMAGRGAEFGHKIVAKKGKRKWRDEQGARQKLQEQGVKPDEMLEEPALKSPTQLEKALKKHPMASYDDIKEFVTSESSGFVLVPVDDPRPEISAKTSAIEDFTAIN